jgi:hypothetical protein
MDLQTSLIMLVVVTTGVSIPFGLMLYSVYKRRKQEYLWVYGVNLRCNDYYGGLRKVHAATIKPPAGNILYASARIGNLQGAYHILSHFSQRLQSIAAHKPVVF